MKCNGKKTMQLIKPIRTVMISLLMVLNSQQLYAREISMLTVEWAPHYGSELPEKGLTTAFKAAGHSSDVDFIPWARALKEVEEGKSDIVMGAYHSQDREEKYIFSDPIYFLELGLIARPGLGISRYDSLRDLTPYSIGISRGFANSEEFDAADYLDKQVATFPNLNIRKLFRGRIDMAVMNFDLFRYEAKKEGFCISNVEFMEPPLETHGLYLMASRKISDGEKIIQDFNQGLDRIRKTGEFDRIVGRFRK
jgi:polar amino acid transport system substrate-binding protein